MNGSINGTHMLQMNFNQASQAKAKKNAASMKSSNSSTLCYLYLDMFPCILIKKQGMQRNKKKAVGNLIF